MRADSVFRRLISSFSRLRSCSDDSLSILDRLLRLRRAERHRAQIDFSELAEGDLVVHLEHGIGRFLGLEKFPVGQAHRLPAPVRLHGKPGSFGLALQQEAQQQEVLVLEFADEAKLYVPLEQAYLVSRYVGAGKKSPPLSSLGDGKWARAKIKAAASIFDYAGKMLAIQAERQMQPGYAFTPDTKWQAEFERSFPFRETPDQMKAIIDTKIDMERPRPMDRLICGDVGFGKTEVAVRAAFKTVMDGKQVAVLAPTTVLGSATFRSVPATYASSTRCGSKCSAVFVRIPNRKKCCNCCAKAVSISSSARTGSFPATSSSRTSAWSSLMRNSGSAFCTKRNSKSSSSSSMC